MPLDGEEQDPALLLLFSRVPWAPLQLRSDPLLVLDGAADKSFKGEACVTGDDTGDGMLAGKSWWW